MLALPTGTQTEISKTNITIPLVLMASEIVQGFENQKREECHNTNPIVTRIENQKRKTGMS
jgi:hypothetical protein